MLGVLLALCASVCWGFSDFFGGLEARRLPGMVVVLLSGMIGTCLLSVIVFAEGGPSIGGPEVLAACVAGVTGALGLSCFYKALSIGVMSIVAPITATGVVVPVLVGLVGGDQPSLLQALGMVAAAFGVLLATKDRSESLEDQRRMRMSAGLALLAAVLIGTGLVALDHVADAGALNGVLFARLVTIGVLATGAVIFRPRFAGGTRAVRGLVTIGVLDVAATCFYCAATTHGLLSITALMSSLYPIFTILLARLVLAEHVQRIQAVGIFAAVAGIALMAAG